MPFTEKTWISFPNLTTPVNATGLNDLEARIGSAIDGVLGWKNVVDYGALTNDTNATTTTAAIQAAIDAAAADGGGIVYFPKGTYSINSALTIAPGSASITFVGIPGGMEPVMSRLRAASGYTGSIISAIGSGVGTVANFCRFNMQDLLLQGRNQVSSTPLVDLSHLVECWFHRCHFTTCIGQTVLRTRVMYNTTMHRCRITDSGSGTAKPAMLIGGQAGGDQTEGSNTFLLSDCQWENNYGTSCEMAGTMTGQTTEGVIISGGKAEINGAAGGSHPMFRFGISRENTLSGVFMAVNAGTGACVDVTTSTDVNMIQGCTLTGASTTSYLVDVQAGGLLIGDSYFNTNNVIAGIRYGSGAAPWFNHVSNCSFFNNAKAIEDNRTGPRVVQRGYTRTIQATATASTTQIAAGATGTLATFTFGSGFNGVNMGDIVRVGHTGNPNVGLVIHGRVTSANNVAVYGTNTTGSAINPPAGTIKVWVEATD